MLTGLAKQINYFVDQSHYYVFPWLLCIAGLWLLNILNWITGSKLKKFVILPRHFRGLWGIVFSPFLHQNFNHLFFNSIPLFVLGLVLLTKGMDTFIWATTTIALVGGLLVWLLGRRANHIGASGLISGYFGFILFSAYLDPSFTTLIVSTLIAYYFGGIFLGIFPQEEKVSWESHLYGFISGIGSAFLQTKIPF